MTDHLLHHSAPRVAKDAARPRRIMIIGTSGSGKSTLARHLGDRFDLPVYHMDREVHWLPGWVERARADKPALVRAIAARDAWVFEGGHSQTYADRLARADLLIWTDAPTALRLWRVTRRSLLGLGRVRPDLAENCPEQLRNLPEFWRYIWTTRHASAAKLRAVFDAAPIPKHHLRGFRQIDAFVRSCR